MTKTMMTAALGAGVALATIGGASAATLDDIKSKGFLQCGVSQGLPGFSTQDDQGNWSGLDVDYCKAIAAAIFGDAEAVRYSPLSAKERFTALSSGEVDILARNTTWTATRDTQLGLNFAGVNYYDGQGFMVRNDLGVDSALQLDGAAVCTNTGTTTELNVTDYFTSNDMDYELVAFEKADEVVSAYDAGRCDVYTTDASGLYAQRLKLTNPDEHKVLPEIISKEPLGPVVRQGDDEFFNLVKWVHFGLLNAEELGVTMENVEEMKSSEDPAVQRLLGQGGNNFGEAIGNVDAAFIAEAVSAVGNYGEIFERNVGPDTPLEIDRGQNALWTEGGLQYAPPVR